MDGRACCFVGGVLYGVWCTELRNGPCQQIAAYKLLYLGSKVHMLGSESMLRSALCRRARRQSQSDNPESTQARPGRYNARLGSPKVTFHCHLSGRHLPFEF